MGLLPSARPPFPYPASSFSNEGRYPRSEQHSYGWRSGRDYFADFNAAQRLFCPRAIFLRTVALSTRFGFGAPSETISAVPLSVLPSNASITRLSLSRS